MATRAPRRIPPDLAEAIDRRIAAGEYRDREEFVEEAVRRMGARLLLDDLQARHGRSGRLTRREEERIVRLVRRVRNREASR